MTEIIKKYKLLILLIIICTIAVVVALIVAETDVNKVPSRGVLVHDCFKTIRT